MKQDCKLIRNLGFVALMLALVLPTIAAAVPSPIRLKAGAIGANSISLRTVDVENESNLWLVQWKSVVHEDEKRQLQAIGSTILRYIPDNTFLVRLSSEDAKAQLSRFDFVERVIAYGQGLNVEPGLTGLGVFSADESVFVTVVVHEGTEMQPILDLFPAELGRVGKQIFAGRIARGDIPRLAAMKDVLWVERYIPVKPFDLKRDELLAEGEEPETAPAEITGYESGTKILNVEKAYAAGIDGTGQFLAFADTGLDKGSESDLHADFVGNLHTARALALGGRSWGDPHSHGTHVAGSIAGNGASSNGAIRGTAFGAKLVAQGMWSDIFNNIFPPGVDVLFDRAYQDGARIHSNSWGRDANGRYDATAREVDVYMFENQDFLAVFAAGNSGKDLDKDGVIDEGTLGSPASAKNTLTVGASKNYLLTGGIQRTMRELRNGEQNWGADPIASSRLSDDERGMAAFSSRGPAADGRLKPDVVAPGTNIVSARSRHASAGEGWGAFDDHYLYMGGTSMATPLVSGAMGLVRQHLMATTGASKISAALLKAAVINSAFDLYPGQFGERAQGQEQPTTRPNNHQGYGRVDVDMLVDGGRSYTFIDRETGLATGEAEEVLEVALTAGQTLRVTMAYTDAAGAASASKALVNDLDLEVVATTGEQLFPNHLASADRTNNVEQVDYVAEADGTYQIRVSGHNVPMGRSGKQPYAVVVSVE